MATLTKRATIYFDPQIHRTLKMKSVEVSKSLSELINDIVIKELSEDKEDLASFADRVSEPSISYESMLKQLKADGKI
ncbi:MAG: CopG family transcriptional regulator [Bacteroidetes bacterium]|nr:CopG family transcriptional regulator [Bacteroidota bacterium]MBU1115375.1 CopG family transcriptional regulator [Bacteroidota bacterium]MBU1797896.1 CopG family transcriptional regulator [Bacteroidota bacterium]